MTLHLSPDKTLGALQTDFSEAFPGLKLAFFSKPHHAFKGSAAKFLVQEKDAPLRDLSPDIKTGYLRLEPHLTVLQVEQLLEEEFALHVQVFRKSGRTWLETSKTDGLTLEQQQAKSVASEYVEQQFIDPMDYREQD